MDHWRIPMEIWWDILQFAVEPSFATDQEFLPQNIQFYFSAIIIHHFSNPGNTHVKKTRAALRLVCRDFKFIVDKVVNVYYRSPLWISPFSPDNAKNYGPAARIDVRVNALGALAHGAHSQYAHELKILTIQSQYNAEIPDVSSVLSRPWALTVLHLSFFNVSDIGSHFPTHVFIGLSLLHTLSVTSHRPLRIDGNLTMPQIRTLFLCCEYTDGSDISQWSFPNLQNLVIDSRGWPHSSQLEDLSVEFVDLLSRHKDHIRSLRLFPCRGSNLSRQSMPAILRSMPNLEALATDFAKYAPFCRQSSILDQVVDLWPSGISAFNNVKHLIHISTHPYGSYLVSNILAESLASTPHLQTLAIIDEPFLQTVEGYSSGETSEECMASLRELDGLCRSRGIKIIGEMGIERCCVLKAWKYISSIQIPPEMASFSEQRSSS